MRVLIPLIFLFSTAIYAQTSKTNEHLDTLCSSYMVGRGYVDQGHLKAAKYIRSEFERIGLRPITQDYFQEFPISVNTFPGDMRLKVGKNELRDGKDYIAKSFSGSGKGKRRIVRLDTLIFEDSVIARDFLKSRLKRKVLIYRQKDFEKLSEMPLDYVEKAFSSFATIELKKKLTASYSSRQYQGVSLEVLDSLFPKDTKRIKFEVEAEYKENLITQNVIGLLPSYRPNSLYILITAHYDHLGKMDDAIFHGANDNASGVSMALDLANILARRRMARKYNYVFVAFGAEETGLNGSEYFVKNSPVPLDSIRMVINLDLMGNGEKGITVVNGKVFTEEMQTLEDLNTRLNYLPEIRKRGKAANSDHYHFSERGVPAFFIYTMGGEPWYHDVYDTPDKLTLEKYDEIISLIDGFIRAL